MMNVKIIAIAIVAIMVVAGAAAVIVLSNNDSNRIIIDVDLEVFGNADKDSKVDINDANLVQDYIDAKKDNSDSLANIEKRISTTFADANQDGTIDSKDVDQIKAVANGTAKNVWLLDGIKEPRKISTEISRIGCEYYSSVEMCLLLGLADKVAAIDYAPWIYKDFYFTEGQQKNIQNMVNCNNPDYDLINSMDLDIYLMFSGTASYEAKQDKIIDCDVIYLGLYNPDLTNTDKSNFVQGILKAGYIFGAVDKAEAYVDWIIGYRDKLLDIAKSIPDSEKPIVGMSNFMSSYFSTGTTTTMTLYSSVDPLGQAAVLGGGINAIDKISTSIVTANSLSVQIDSIFNDNDNFNVNFFFLHLVKHTFGAVTMDTPDHGYLQNNQKEVNDGEKLSKSQSLITDEQIQLIAGDFRNGCSGGVVLGAYIGSIINPDAYKDIDPIKIHNEYVQLLGIGDYDVSKKGTFISSGTQ